MSLPLDYNLVTYLMIWWAIIGQRVPECSSSHSDTVCVRDQHHSRCIRVPERTRCSRAAVRCASCAWQAALSAELLLSAAAD